MDIIFILRIPPIPKMFINRNQAIQNKIPQIPFIPLIPGYIL